MKCLILPAWKTKTDREELAAAKFAPAVRKGEKVNAPRSLWALWPIPLKDGRFAIPADVLDHPAFANAEELKGYAVEELEDKDFDLPVSEVL